MNCNCWSDGSKKFFLPKLISVLYAHAALVSVLYDSSIQNSFDPLMQHTIRYNHLITCTNVFFFIYCQGY